MKKALAIWALAAVAAGASWGAARGVLSEEFSTLS